MRTRNHERVWPEGAPAPDPTGRPVSIRAIARAELWAHTSDRGRPAFRYRSGSGRLVLLGRGLIIPMEMWRRSSDSPGSEADWIQVASPRRASAAMGATPSQERAYRPLPSPRALCRVLAGGGAAVHRESAGLQRAERSSLGPDPLTPTPTSRPASRADGCGRRPRTPPPR